jgi:hypothetical protein
MDLCIMVILIANNLFVWQNQSTPILWSSRRNANMTVYRGDAIIGNAKIGSIGTHGAWDGFDGLRDITGTEYQQFIKAESFQNGDRLEIALPKDISDQEYWQAMIR